MYKTIVFKFLIGDDFIEKSCINSMYVNKHTCKY